MTSGAGHDSTGRPREAEEPQGTPQSPAAPQPGSAGDVTGDVTGDSAAGPAGEAGSDTAPSAGPDDEAALESDLADARKALAELTGDLQRLQAEYLNYKRRVERDRELVRQNATFAAVTPLLEVLDTIDRAREHGELDGGLKAVAEQLERVVAGLGLTRFGKPGDEFDPMVHEALTHAGSSPDVATVTCQHVVKAGYRIGERVVRAAQVVVVDPEPDDGAGPETGAETATATATEDTDVPRQE